MIYLFALFLLTATPDTKDGRWQSGYYTEGTFTFETIAACEAHRTSMILKTKKNEGGHIVSARISKCAASKDIVEFNTYSPMPKPPTQQDDLKGDKS